MSHQLTPDEDFESIIKGRNVHEQHYNRGKKEQVIGGSKIDLMQRKDGSILISEVKKSSRFLDSAILQLKFYLSLFHERGVAATGALKVPEEKKQVLVSLTQEDISNLERVKSDIRSIVGSETPPKPVRIMYCSTCAYSEFCWS